MTITEASPSLWERQCDLEAEMAGLGKARFWKSLEEARTKERETNTSYGVKLLRQAIEPLAKAISEFVAKALGGGAGRKNLAAKRLANIEPHVAAYIAAKVVLDQVSARNTYQAIAIQVAGAIEDELRMRKFFEDQPDLYYHIKTQLDEEVANPGIKSKRLVRQMKRHGITWDDWSLSEKLHVGQKLIELLSEATGMVEIVRCQEGKDRTVYRVDLTPAVEEWIKDHLSLCELLTPVYLPTVIPPKPWSSPFDGGYHTNSARRLRLVKTRNLNYLEELKNTDMPVVYEAVNSLQNTAWKINKPVLEVLRQVWDLGVDLGKLPQRNDLELPSKPHDIATNLEARILWKRAARNVYTKNARLRSKRLQVAKTIWVAGKFLEDEAFYFPYQLDFRGRIYAVPLFLNPQGPDYAKALLTFAHGKPIMDATAAGWLAIHGANLWGYDKVSLEDRIQWVEENEDRILAVAADPLGNLWWADADKPWQFLAFCFEWSGFQREGYGYVSSLPIALDGSCNGLQHFSAMLRDPIGGKAVNLVPSDHPQDIYQCVADVALSRLRTDIGNPLGRQWLDFGVDRKITKRPVMILPYGGTLHACRRYVQDALEEKVREGKDNPFGDQTYEAVNYLADIIWSSIGEVVIAAREAMDWLQRVARVVAKEGLPIVWTTPAGFPVQQAYPDERAKRVKTQLQGTFVYLTLKEELSRIDKKRQAQGISPNFVHSMDASVLMDTVCLAKLNGITSFAMVHDSYGTVAADTETMATCLREAFVQMYQDNDVLADFLENMRAMLPDKSKAMLPPLPMKGSLDITLVRQSDFFFA